MSKLTQADIDFDTSITLAVVCAMVFIAFLIIGPIDLFMWCITIIIGVASFVFLALAYSALWQAEGGTDKEKICKVSWNGQSLKCPLCGGDDWKQTGDDHIGILSCVNCQPKESDGGE